ncbi:MAG TPA: AraC family transcriptional regulator [Pyrinomonadaceae bacterium]|jgi:AraC-like DNA-binding protein
MTVPETTSAEAFWRYAGGTCLFESRGEAWRDVKAWLTARYHIDLRMNEARRLLRETKMGVVDVALEVGYANPSHFARLFRRETGLSPSNYRRQR